jgi:hypothetical protein
MGCGVKLATIAVIFTIKFLESAEKFIKEIMGKIQKTNLQKKLL